MTTPAQREQIDKLIQEGRISPQAKEALEKLLEPGTGYDTVEEACDGETLWLLQTAVNPAIVAEVVEENASLIRYDVLDETCMRYLTGQILRRAKGTANPTQVRAQIVDYMKTRK